MSAVRQNAAGGKGPCSGHIGGARTREGMSGETGTNSPGGRQAHRQSAPIATPTVGRSQTVPGPSLPRPIGSGGLTSSGRRGGGFGIRGSRNVAT